MHADDPRARVRDYMRMNAVWREHLRALLDEQERMEELQRVLMDEGGLQSASEEHLADLGSMVEGYERVLILWALASVGGHQVRAAALLGVGPTTLNEKIKRLHIPVPRTARESRLAGEAIPKRRKPEGSESAQSGQSDPRRRHPSGPSRRSL